MQSSQGAVQILCLYAGCKFYVALVWQQNSYLEFGKFPLYMSSICSVACVMSFFIEDLSFVKLPKLATCLFVIDVDLSLLCGWTGNREPMLEVTQKKWMIHVHSIKSGRKIKNNKWITLLFIIHRGYDFIVSSKKCRFCQVTLKKRRLKGDIIELEDRWHCTPADRV